MGAPTPCRPAGWMSTGESGLPSLQRRSRFSGERKEKMRKGGSTAFTRVAAVAASIAGSDRPIPHAGSGRLQVAARSGRALERLHAPPVAAYSLSAC